MTRFEAWSIHIANTLVGGTGVVYGWMRYFARSDDPFSIVNHPWQPDLQHVHILVAPLLVFAIGVIWRTHVWQRLFGGFRHSRRSGASLALLLGPMVFSGYAIQVSVEEFWRETWIGVHLATSGLWLVVVIFHLALSGARRNKRGRNGLFNLSGRLSRS